MTTCAVRDAETGEELELLIWSQQQNPPASRSLRPSTSVGHLPLASRGSERLDLFVETQSTRPLGGAIGWGQQQQAKVEVACPVCWSSVSPRSGLTGVDLA